MAPIDQEGWQQEGWQPDGWHAGEAGPPVEVPDVVGDLQADGIAELEGDGFVVAIVQTYSASVAAGVIISQLPTAGSFASLGSTVTITVSLGPQPINDNPGGFGGGGGGRHYEPMSATAGRWADNLKKKKRRPEPEPEPEPEAEPEQPASAAPVVEAKPAPAPVPVIDSAFTIDLRETADAVRAALEAAEHSRRRTDEEAAAALLLLLMAEDD